jgi:hypothetical protein
VNLRFLIFRLGKREKYDMDVVGQKVEQSGYIWSLQWNETHYYSKANCIRNETSEVKLVTQKYRTT